MLQAEKRPLPMNLKLYPIVQQQGIPAAVMSFRFRITARCDSNDFPAIGQNSASSRDQWPGERKDWGVFFLDKGLVIAFDDNDQL